MKIETRKRIAQAIAKAAIDAKDEAMNRKPNSNPKS